MKKTAGITAGLVKHFGDVNICHRTSGLILWQMMINIMPVDHRNVEGHSKLRGLQDFSLVFYLMSSLCIKYSKGALQKSKQF